MWFALLCSVALSPCFPRSYLSVLIRRRNLANISPRHLTSLTGPKLAILPQRPGAGIKDMGRHIEAEHFIREYLGT